MRGRLRRKRDRVTALAAAVLVFAWACLLPGPEGSAYAADTAADGTRECRAFLVGETYPNTPKELDGPDNDVALLGDALGALHTPYAVTQSLEPTKAQILSGIAGAFADADEDDLSLFYYSGHGSSSGQLLPADYANGNLTVAELEAALSNVPGKVVVIMDCCYSGKSITPTAQTSSAMQGKAEEENGGTEADAQAFMANVIAAFEEADTAGAAGKLQGRKDLSARAGELIKDKYYVITACQPNEQSWSGGFMTSGTKKYYGLTTLSIAAGMGWVDLSVAKQATPTGTCALPADANGDEAVSLRECFADASARIPQLFKDLGSSKSQTMMVYPENSRQVIFNNNEDPNYNDDRTLEAAEITVADATYTGEVLTPEIQVTYRGETLGTGDYTWSAEEPLRNSDTYKLTFTGTGSYGGAAEAYFTIHPAPLQSASLSSQTLTWTGKDRTPKVTEVTGCAADGLLTKNVDFLVTAPSPRSAVGIYRITVTGLGNYNGTKTPAFKIIPAAPVISRTAAKSGAVVLTMQDAPAGTGGAKYRIKYRQAGTNTWKELTTGLQTKKITGLKSGKSYYFKVRSEKTVDGRTFVGHWTKAVSETPR